MYPAPIDEYIRPQNIAEALRALSQHPAGEAHFIAGGQSLMQAVKSRLLSPRCLVDLQAVDELKTLTIDNSGVGIGAMTRYIDIANKQRLHGAYHALVDAASHVGDRQVRNRGTIGGSLCWNYIAACMPPTVLGLGATLRLAASGGAERDLAAEDFFGGPLETARADDELLVSIKLPPAPNNTGSAYKKWGLVHDALPVIGICAYLELDDNQSCRTARVAVGGLASGPTRAPSAERELVGKQATDATAIRTALDAAATEIETQSDHWADAAYRKQLIRRLGVEVVNNAFARATG